MMLTMSRDRELAGRGGERATLDRLVRNGLSEEVTLEQSPKLRMKKSQLSALAGVSQWLERRPED